MCDQRNFAWRNVLDRRAKPYFNQSWCSRFGIRSESTEFRVSNVICNRNGGNAEIHRTHPDFLSLQMVEDFCRIVAKW